MVHELATLDHVVERVADVGVPVVRCRGQGIGIGYYRPEGEGGWLKGICPKSWAVRLGLKPEGS